MGIDLTVACGPSSPSQSWPRSRALRRLPQNSGDITVIDVGLHNSRPGIAELVAVQVCSGLINRASSESPSSARPGVYTVWGQRDLELLSLENVTSPQFTSIPTLLGRCLGQPG